MKKILFGIQFFILFIALNIVLAPASAFAANTDITLHAIVAAPIGIDTSVGSVSTIKSAFDSAKSAKVLLASLEKLTQRDQIKAFDAFQALAEASQLGVNVSYTAMSGAQLVNQMTYYAVDLKIPLSLFSADGAASIFTVLDGFGTLGEQLTQENKDTNKMVLAALNVVLGGAKISSIITGFTLPGGAIVVTAAPVAVNLLLQYTPKVYKYYFTSMLSVDKMNAIPKNEFDRLGTYTYVQCHYKGTTYWGKEFDENLSQGILSKMAGNISRWEHKVSDFKLYGTWLTSSDKSQSGFATRNSVQRIMKSCKLPILIKDKQIKTGKTTEVRKLYRTISDSGFTFEARDFGLIGKAHPIIFVRQSSKNSLTN